MDPDKLKNIVERLFSLRVNTIVKPNITLAPMPSMALALVDITSAYAARIRLLAGRDAEKAAGGEVSQASLDELADLASERLAEHAAEGRTAEADTFMLSRIHDNARQISALLTGKKPPLAFDGATAAGVRDADLAPSNDQKLMIRKMWDLGTEEVAMQTVIYLDGDVITRLQPRYYQDANSQALIQVHNKGVESSIACWGDLMRLIETFVATLLAARKG